jgi:hypothetical protein
MSIDLLESTTIFFSLATWRAGDSFAGRTVDATYAGNADGEIGSYDTMLLCKMPIQSLLE